MKTKLGKKREAGAVLLPMTICAFAVLTTFAVSHLWLVVGEHRSMARAQAWNYALSVAEAGVEEGMAQLNAGGAGVGVNPNLAANNWTDNTGAYGYYGPKVSSLTNGGYSASYSVTIIPGVHPVITSTATVRDPRNSQDIQRTVQLVTTPFTPQTNHGIISITNATLSGNFNVVSGNVASVYGTVTLKNADVIGTVETGGGVAANPGVNSTVTGGFNTNFYVDLPDVKPPYTSGLVPPSDTQTRLYTSINFGASGNFYVNGAYNTKDKMPIVVTATNVVLYVTGDVAVPSLTVAPGASFKLFVGTTNTSSPSTATIGSTSTASDINGTGTPDQFDYFGLPSNTTIDFKNALTSLNGFIYAPEATLTQNGNMSIYGSLVANSYTSNGGGKPNNLTLRDVSDSGKPPTLYYVAQSWTEL